MKLLLGVSGSVAAVKAVELVEKLQAVYAGIEIKIVVTQRGRCFLKDEDVKKVEGMDVVVFQDESEWLKWNKKGDPVLHIELRKWADALLIAPLSANTLAKIAGGMCDNLLTSVVRAWDMEKPIIVCPAMNTHMWESPFTVRHLETISEVYSCTVVMPKDDYVLACGDRGTGAMASIDDIVDSVRKFMK